MANKRIVSIPVSVYHIVGLAVAGQDGRYWYHSEGATLQTAAETLKVSAEHFASVLAITSPQVPVARNGRITVGFLSKGLRWAMMPSVHSALDHYLATGEIRGPKTGPFARALLGDEQAIVLDVWMARAFGVPQGWFKLVDCREKCEAMIRQAAAILGWTPAQVQAAVWTEMTRKRGGGSLQLMRWVDMYK
jgi:hypothetical protein